MTKMQELYEKVAGDSTLQTKFAEIMKDAETAGEEATKEKLVAFAREAGYEVSIDEVREYFKTLSEQKSGALSDAELDAVAGGKSCVGWGQIAESVLTLGVGCAVDSAVTEIKEAGGCGKLFQ